MKEELYIRKLLKELRELISYNEMYSLTNDTIKDEIKMMNRLIHISYTLLFDIQEAKETSYSIKWKIGGDSKYNLRQILNGYYRLHFVQQNNLQKDKPFYMIRFHYENESQGWVFNITKEDFENELKLLLQQTILRAIEIKTWSNSNDSILDETIKFVKSFLEYKTKQKMKLLKELKDAKEISNYSYFTKIKETTIEELVNSHLSGESNIRKIEVSNDEVSLSVRWNGMSGRFDTTLESMTKAIIKY